MPSDLKILHLEDIATDAELVYRELKRSNIEFDTKLVDNRHDYTLALKHYVPDIILSDHSLPAFNSIEALTILKQSNLNIPFILITATVSEDFAVDVMKAGATDYILKDRLQRLPKAVTNAIEEFRSDAESRRANQELNILFNTINEVFFSRDLVESKLLQISPACEAVYGYTEQEFLTNTDLWSQIMYPEDNGIQRENDAKFALGETTITQYRIIHKNGDIKWLESKVIPKLNTAGVLVKLYGVSRDITVRKLAELNLKLSEQRFRELLENSNDLLTVTNIEGVITYISPNVTKVMGYDAKFFAKGHKGKVFFHPDEQAYHHKIFNELRSNPGKVFPFTNRVLHANGNWIWVEGTVTNLLHVPAVNGVVTNFRDITERKENEERIFEAAQAQAAILNALPPNIALLDEQGKIMAVNESWKKFTLQNNLGMPNYGIGYSYLAISEKAIGIDKNEVNILTRGINEVIRGEKKAFTMEYPCHLPTEKRWFQLVIAPLAEKNGKGAVVLHINITDRKLTEESLLQSEANLRSVFENTDLSIVLFDNELKIVSFNNNAKVLSVKNFTKKVTVGTSVFGYFPKERRPTVKQAVKRVIDNHEMVEYEVSYENIDGQLDWFEVKWVGVTDKKGKNVGLILTLKDITHRKLKQVERKKITTDLIKRNNDLEQFAYIVSHNLRAPVANIKGLSDLLNSVTQSNDESFEELQALSSSINNLDDVINDLNNILQINSETNDKLETVSLTELLNEISESLNLLIDKNNVTITGDFKEIEELLTLKSYIYSIFQNLITNSIKYKQADVDPVISITSKKSWNMITIIFEDNGRGIDMAKNGPHIFGLYKRFDTSVEGKGMGLFMVKIEVESLGGTISIESELNAGTLFTINLPIKSLV